MEQGGLMEFVIVSEMAAAMCLERLSVEPGRSGRAAQVVAPPTCWSVDNTAHSTAARIGNPRYRQGLPASSRAVAMLWARLPTRAIIKAAKVSSHHWGLCASSCASVCT